MIACELDGYKSPIVKSNFLQFEYTSPEYPSSINEMSSGLCVLRIDHNWKFAPRNNSTSLNQSILSSSDSMDSSTDLYDSTASEEELYEELCGLNTEASTAEGGGGDVGGGGEGIGTGGEGPEGTKNPQLPTKKPKICQVRTN